MRDSVAAEIAAVTRARLREGGPDDHFYGAWFGHRSSDGGHPATITSGGTPSGGDVTHTQMTKMYANWDSKLSSQQLRALEIYTGNGYKDINPYLQGRTPNLSASDKAAIDGEVQSLDAALAVEPLPQSITVWHGGSGADLVGAKVGDVIERRGFTSTSISRTLAEGFSRNELGVGVQNKVIYKMLLPAGMHAAYLDSGYGTAMEKEMLLGRDTSWRIESMTSLGVDETGSTWQRVVLVPA
jgi:hypothetical protein